MKKRILQKASELFLEKGFKETTMDELAKATGISKKTIYKFFKDKEDLIKQTTEYYFGFIQQNINEIKKRKLNPLEEFFQIRKFIKETVKTTSCSPYAQLKMYYPEIANNLLNKKKESVLRSMEENLKRGMEEGLYKKKLDVEFIKRWYFGNVYLLINNETFPAEEFDKHRISNAFIKIFLKSITTKKGKAVLKQLEKKYEL